ncbi:ATPase domain-containing protein [Geoglobus acetivorans]|uniref:KaiC domain-containing protein n=1 Tax=Geoglobus acetivorans TaxID=565033 RepID=A0ABZ3H7Z5_GEOAI|nr:KaiC domain-containing protein [Geoglobus acetivorans]
MRLLSTGIRGLDAMLGGGIPEGYFVSVIGFFGTGKTTLGLHFINEGFSEGDSCLIISFDEDEESILATAENYGMDFSPGNGSIQVIKLDPLEVKKRFESFENELRHMFEKIMPARILVDSITVLETLFDDAGRYSFLSKLRGLLKSINATAVVTSECDKDNPLRSKFGILEYVSDGMISMRIYRENELEEATLAIEVLKMRRRAHMRIPRPYAITSSGIEVFLESELI